MKICNKCNKPKKLLDFYKNPTSKDGHINTCKRCKLMVQKNYDNNIKKTIQYIPRFN